MKKEIIAFISSDGLSRMCRKPIEKFATWGLRALIGSLIAAAAGLENPTLRLMMIPVIAAYALSAFMLRWIREELGEERYKEIFEPRVLLGLKDVSGRS